MKSLRWTLMLAGLLAMLLLAARPARADDNPVNVYANPVYGPAPAAVVSGATSSAYLVASSDSPLLQQEAYLVTSNWSWSMSSPQYSADGSTFGAPASGQVGNASLVSPSSSLTWLNFYGTPGYWKVTCSVSVYYQDNFGNTWSGSNSFDVTFIVVSVNIGVRQNGSSDAYASTVEIGVGHKSSAAHKADVKITVSPAVAVQVPISLTGGTGSSADTNAALTISGVNGNVGPGQSAIATIDGSGVLTGSLLSSDTEGIATIGGADGTASATFAWSDYHGSDAWVSNPDYIIPGGTSTQTVKLLHRGFPLGGHRVHFYVDYVEYWDETAGQVVPIPFDPANPHALDDYASFPNYEQYTDGNGVVKADVSIVDDEDIVYIHCILYDEDDFIPKQSD